MAAKGDGATGQRGTVLPPPMTPAPPMNEVQPEAVPPMETMALEQVLAALADPVRLTIVRALAAQQGSWCSDLYAVVASQVGRSTFSHHTKVLREAGIIRVRVSGTRRLVALRADDLNERFPGLVDVIVNAAPGLG